MPITAELKIPNSPVNKWFKENLPDIRQLMARWIAQVPRETIRPATKNSRSYPWPTVGYASEYWLRQAMGAKFMGTMPSKIPLLGKALEENDPQWATWHTNVELLCRTIDVNWLAYQRGMTSREDNAWALYWAGICEGVLRGWKPNQEPSQNLHRLNELSNLLRKEDFKQQFHVPGNIIQDIVNLSELSLCGDLDEIIQNLGSHVIVDNPIMSNGKIIGGADGDVIVEDMYLDIKTTTDPKRDLEYHLKEILSYVALDGNDGYRMRQIGILYVRQNGAVVSIDVGDALKLAGSTIRSVPEMQASFEEMLMRDYVGAAEGIQPVSQRRPPESEHQPTKDLSMTKTSPQAAGFIHGSRAGRGEATK